jgi:coatomer subunit delta
VKPFRGAREEEPNCRANQLAMQRRDTAGGSATGCSSILPFDTPEPTPLTQTPHVAHTGWWRPSSSRAERCLGQRSRGSFAMLWGDMLTTEVSVPSTPGPSSEPAAHQIGFQPSPWKGMGQTIEALSPGTKDTVQRSRRHQRTPLPPCTQRWSLIDADQRQKISNPVLAHIKLALAPPVSSKLIDELHFKQHPNMAKFTPSQDMVRHSRT